MRSFPNSLTAIEQADALRLEGLAIYPDHAVDALMLAAHAIDPANDSFLGMAPESTLVCWSPPHAVPQKGDFPDIASSVKNMLDEWKNGRLWAYF